MKLIYHACGVLLATLFLGACTTYTYDEHPEGYVTQTVPLGYTALMVGGLSYMHHNNHYYRHWPDYGYVVVRPPHGRPPYTRPPNRPGRPGNPGHPGRPSQPIANPRPPSYNRPSTPSYNRPSTRPSTPSYNRPSTRPAARPSGRSRR